MTTQKILTRDFVIIFFAQFAFASVFYALDPYSSDLSVKAGIYECCDRYDYWRIQYFSLGYQTSYWEGSIKDP